MGRAARANPMAAQARTRTTIRPVVMPRTGQRVSPARMSPEGLAAWTKARLTRDLVLTEALIERMVAKALPSRRLEVRIYLEQVLAEQRRKPTARDHHVAAGIQYAGGVPEVNMPDASDSPPPAVDEPSTYDLLRTDLAREAERGGLLTLVRRVAEDQRRTDEACEAR